MVGELYDPQSLERGWKIAYNDIEASHREAPRAHVSPQRQEHEKRCEAEDDPAPATKAFSEWQADDEANETRQCQGEREELCVPEKPEHETPNDRRRIAASQQVAEYEEERREADSPRDEKRAPAAGYGIVDERCDDRPRASRYEEDYGEKRYEC